MGQNLPLHKNSDHTDILSNAKYVMRVTCLFGVGLHYCVSISEKSMRWKDTEEKGH